ncbi:hypothetical protein JW962_00400 [Candidatus Dojkabacteria bacterium]|nr:hypothetical protein [Candidatus Dojkabacteria bacterium]
MNKLSRREFLQGAMVTVAALLTGCQNEALTPERAYQNLQHEVDTHKGLNSLDEYGLDKASELVRNLTVVYNYVYGGSVSSLYYGDIQFVDMSSMQQILNEHTRILGEQQIDASGIPAKTILAQGQVKTIINKGNSIWTRSRIRKDSKLKGSVLENFIAIMTHELIRVDSGIEEFDPKTAPIFMSSGYRFYRVKQEPQLALSCLPGSLKDSGTLDSDFNRPIAVFGDFDCFVNVMIQDRVNEGYKLLRAMPQLTGRYEASILEFFKAIGFESLEAIHECYRGRAVKLIKTIAERIPDNKGDFFITPDDRVLRELIAQENSSLTVENVTAEQIKAKKKEIWGFQFFVTITNIIAKREAPEDVSLLVSQIFG